MGLDGYDGLDRGCSRSVFICPSLPSHPFHLHQRRHPTRVCTKESGKGRMTMLTWTVWMCCLFMGLHSLTFLQQTHGKRKEDKASTHTSRKKNRRKTHIRIKLSFTLSHFLSACLHACAHAPTMGDDRVDGQSTATIFSWAMLFHSPFPFMCNTRH